MINMEIIQMKNRTHMYSRYRTIYINSRRSQSIMIREDLLLPQTKVLGIFDDVGNILRRHNSETQTSRYEETTYDIGRGQWCGLEG